MPKNKSKVAPNEEKDDDKYHNIFITDIQMHATESRKPTPWYRAILKSFRSKKPGRFYTKHFETNEKKRTLRLTFPPSPKIAEEIEKAKKLGKEIRFITPKGGTPIYFGKDAIEKLKAEKKKEERKKKRRLLTRFWRDDNIEQD